MHSRIAFAYLIWFVFPKAVAKGRRSPLNFVFFVSPPGGIYGFAEKCTERALKFAVHSARFKNLQ